VFRGLGGILGLFAAIAAVTWPILFISNSLNEADSPLRHTNSDVAGFAEMIERDYDWVLYAFLRMRQPIAVSADSATGIQSQFSEP
jgi:hypothetical protein